MLGGRSVEIFVNREERGCKRLGGVLFNHDVGGKHYANTLGKNM